MRRAVRTSVVVLFLGSAVVAHAAGESFRVARTAEAVVVRAGEREVLRYQLRKPADSALTVDSACYFHPVATPGGTVVTDVAPDDHRHHRGIFLAWVEMHGAGRDADFWGWGKHARKEGRQIVNRAVTGLAGGRRARFRARNEWQADGTPMVREDLQVALQGTGPAHVLDLVYTLTPVEDVRLARWAFSGFVLRARKDGSATFEGPDGPVDLPAPKHTDPETDWPAAAWYGVTLALPDGGVASTAVIDHPRNPPALWHNVAGIRMVNPCIVAPGEVRLRAGRPLVLRYRVVLQDGPLDRDRIQHLARQFRGGR